MNCDCRVTIRSATDAECKKERSCSLSSLVKRGASLVQSFVNTLGLFTSGFDLHKIEARSSDPYLRRCPFLGFTGIPTHHASTLERLSREILKPHRGDTESGFVLDNGPHSIFGLIKDMLGDNSLSPDDIIFTCSPEFTKLYKKVLDRYVSAKVVAESKDPIQKMCISLTENLPGTLKAERLALHVATSALQIVLFESYDNESHFADCLERFFEYIVRKFERKSTEHLQIELHRHLFWMTVDKHLQEGKGAAGAIQREGMLSEKQLKMFIFSLFFAGMDSTRWSLTHGLYELAKNQGAYSTESLRGVMVESLRAHPPVLGVSRVAARPLSIDVCQNGKTTSYFIEKGDLLLPAPNLIATKQLDSPIPAFLPGLPWHPFGSGTHLCPGAPLYNELAPLFFRALLDQYALSTDETNLQPTGSFINKLKGPVILKLQMIPSF